MAVDLPPLEDWDGAEDLAAALLGAGPSEPGGMGDAPLSWQAIKAWLELTEAWLSPGDLEALRELSAEFVAACGEYREKLVPAPYGEVKADPVRAADLLRRALDALVSGNGKRKPVRKPAER